MYGFSTNYQLLALDGECRLDREPGLLLPAVRRVIAADAALQRAGYGPGAPIES